MAEPAAARRGLRSFLGLFTLCLAGPLAWTSAWHQGITAGILGLGALLLPERFGRVALGLGLAAAVAASPHRAVAAAGCVVVGALGAFMSRAEAHEGRRPMYVAAGVSAVLGVVLAAKEVVAARVLPAAAEAIPAALWLGAAPAVGLWVAAAVPSALPVVVSEDARGVSVHQAAVRPSLRRRAGAALTGFAPVAVAMILVGVVTTARLAALVAAPSAARLDAAVAVDATPLVYGSVLTDARKEHDSALLEALVNAAPARDEAALALGWERALALGWRPQFADAATVIPVARALDAAGRGGEALRLLAHHPRTGEVDALRALFERAQGVPVAWRGAVLGTKANPAVSTPLLAAPLVFDHDGSSTIELTTPTALGLDMALRVDCDGTSAAGAPLLELRWDAEKPETLTCPAAGWGTPLALAAGPHRLRVAFVNDLDTPEGDRNVRVLGLAIVPSAEVFGN